MSKDNLTIEQSLARLEEITAKLENPNTSLEESMELYKEGVVLSKQCKEKLTTIADEIKKLSDDGQ